MFAVNLKPLVFCNSFRLSKKVFCTVFRNTLLEKTPQKNICVKCFSSRVFNYGDRKLLATPFRPNYQVNRQVVKKAKSGGPIKWKTFAIVAGISVVFLIYFRYLKNEKLRKREALRNREIGKAKLGGRFDLVDQDNKPVKSEDLIGEWLLIYFGFTHCPDICPDELEKMVEVVDKIEQRHNMHKVKPVFITVDPERDTPSVIKKYLSEFSDKIIGLTGTVEQIAAVCKAYRVYFSPGPKDSDADYIVDHSIIMYLVDPEGNFIDYYGQNKNSTSIIDSILVNQVKHDALHKSSLKKALEFFVS